MSHNKVSGVMV